jgi:hypothetical protein
LPAIACAASSWGRPGATTRRAQFDTAVALADACGAPYEQALTLLAGAALDAVSGHTVRAICAPLGADFALARAEALAAPVARNRRRA